MLCGVAHLMATLGDRLVSPSPGSSFPDRMREAQVPLVSDTKAKSVYGSSYLPGLMAAAGKTGKDACQGDSGGPMFAKADGRYRQIGITSFGAQGLERRILWSICRCKRLPYQELYH